MKSRMFPAQVLVLALALIGLAAPPSARAAVIGFYGTAGLGASDWDDSELADYTDDMDTRHSGVGFVLGSNSTASPLNYRVSIGYEEVSHLGQSGNPDFSMYGVVIDQDLLFSLSRSRGPVRGWLGPEVRFGFFNGSPDEGTSGDQDFFMVGLGPVLGADFVISPWVSFSWKIGYIFSNYFNDENSWDDDDGGPSVDEQHAFASLSILFSTWDGYRDDERSHEPPDDYPPPRKPPPPRPRRW